MYKLTNTSIIVRIADGAFIPADLTNIDYRDYLDWLAAGNTPEPADAPDPAIERAAKLDQVRTVREGILNRLAGIALAASLSGDKATTAAYVTVRAGLLDITKAWPADASQISATVRQRYAALVAQCTPQMLGAFAEVDQ